MNIRVSALTALLAWPGLALAQGTAAPPAGMPAMPEMPAMPTTSGAMPTMPGMPGGMEGMTSMMHLAAHNQLGILRYCQARGSVGADVVALQEKIIGLLPPATVAGEDQAEADGKAGSVEVGGQKVSMTDAASSRGTTVDAMCKEIGSALQAQAVNLPR